VVRAHKWTSLFHGKNQLLQLLELLVAFQAELLLEEQLVLQAAKFY